MERVMAVEAIIFMESIIVLVMVFNSVRGNTISHLVVSSSEVFITWLSDGNRSAVGLVWVLDGVGMVGHVGCILHAGVPMAYILMRLQVLVEVGTSLVGYMVSSVVVGVDWVVVLGGVCVMLVWVMAIVIGVIRI
jgi:hypothetical protein